METIPLYVTNCERDAPVQSRVVSTMLVSQRDSLERVWGYPLAQSMIAECTGIENPSDDFRIMRADQERRTGISWFANDISQRLIHIAANQLIVSEEELTPEQAINTLFEIVEAKFHFVFALPIRGAREREYSMYHRFACTLYQVTDVHGHLVSMGATDTFSLKVSPKWLEPIPAGDSNGRQIAITVTGLPGKTPTVTLSTEGLYTAYGTITQTWNPASKTVNVTSIYPD